MRKSFFVFVSTAVIAVLLCCSCQKERFVEELEEVGTSSADIARTIVFSIDAFEAEAGIEETKTAYDANGGVFFAAADTVGIFPSKGAQVYFEIEGDDVGKQYVRFDGGGWALKEGYSYLSYYPFVGDFYLGKNHIPVEYVDLTQDGNSSLNHVSPVDFLYTDLCKVQDGSISFTYHRLNCILRPRVTLPIGTYSKIVIQAEDDVFVSKGYYDLTADTPSIIGTEFTDHLTLNLENATFAEETAFVGNLMTAPVDISNMPINVFIYRSDSTVYYYTYERTNALEANTPYGLRCSDLKVYVEKQDRSLSFNTEKVTCTLGNIPEKPVLAGNYSTVAYSSSDETVATVDADGNVTPVATGTVTITATADEDDLYLEGSASYSLTVIENSSSTYTKVSSITVGGTYLIVDTSDVRLFTGDTDGSFKNVYPESTVIIDDKGTLVGYEFTVENSGDNYYLRYNDGKYLVCNYNNGKTGLLYVDSQSEVTYPYALKYGENGAFFFSTTQMNSASQTDQVLYYKAADNVFKIGGSGRSIGVHLYMKGGKQNRGLSFDPQSVTCTLGDIPEKPALSGAYSSVTYSSSDETVATVDADGKVTPLAAGIVTITASAEEDDQYNAASATYTLRILKGPSGAWVDMGSFNLENDALYYYLNDASSSYSDTDDDTNTVMATYASGSAYSYVTRKDCPNPVTITFDNAASSTTVISIYNDESLTDPPVWTQTATMNSTSADVYNLIPGRKYYYTVSENGIVWEKGYFNTTGRRRMIKVSDTNGRGYANNCRDLGGLKVIDKGVEKIIKYGYMFRGTNMDKTTAAEQSLLLGFMNVGMDIDLRNGNSSNSGYGNNGNSTRWRPLPETIDYTAPGFADGNNFKDLTTISKVREVITAFFNTAKSGKATYFHCYSGADRTGYIAMLIEGLLGVSEKDCSIDYELTSFSVVGSRFRIGYVPGQSEDYDFRDGIAFLRSQGDEGDTFQDKIEKYLIGTVGITQAEIDEFKGLVLEKSN